MKQFCLTLLIIISSFVLKAQSYGNEWINYSQKYFYFQITQEGVYRLHRDTLLNAGIPLATIDPRNIQIYSRGIEVPIYIEGENDGVFNNSDFIELYAVGNDGYLDSLLYDKASSQSNPYYSLFTDASTYYITWNNSIDNERMKLETSINFGSFNKSNFFFKEAINVEASSYYRGETVTTKNTDPLYHTSEGWFGPVFNYEAKVLRSFNTSNAYFEGPVSQFKTVFTGQSNYEENPDHRIGVEYKNKANSYTLLVDTLFDGYKKISLGFQIPSLSLNAAQTDFRYSSLYDESIKGNRTAIAYSYLKFPHTFNLENQTTYQLIIPDDEQGKSYLEMTNFSVSGTARLYDLDNAKRISVVSSAGVHRSLVPNSGSEKRCFLTSEGQIKSVNAIKPVSLTAQFPSFDIKGADFLILTHESLLEGANAYAEYRSSKGYKPIVVNVEDLYHQFSFGINKNPLAIKRFAHYALNNWEIKPAHLFIIGKALYAESYRNNSSYFAQTLVPSFGVPPCDALLTAGLNGTLYEPAIPTGRIAVRTNEEIKTYLNKIIEYETELPVLAEWKKNVLHFGGGVSQIEQNTLAGYLNGYKQIIEDTLIGAHVHTFLKTSTAPVQITVSDSIKSLLNEGASLINFFAHGTATTFDISTDDPSNYNNKGKYPVFIANACYSGDIHLPSYYSTSEKQVLIPDKGGIAFLSTTQEGYPPFLDLYTKEFYKNLSYKLYGKSLGEIIKATSKNIQDPKNAYIKDICLFTTLHGDPAIKPNAQNIPDIALSEQNVFFSPSEVTTEVDSFAVNIELTNLGKSVLDSFNILVVRVMPNGTVDSAFVWINKLIYKDTVSCYFKILNPNESGLNSFDVYADFLGLIAEVSKANNKTNVLLNIKSNDIIPVYPYDFALVPKQGITLKASTSDPLAKAANYVFEIDTTDLFNSPIKERNKINRSGGLISWKPQLLNNMIDSTVYFWRVSPDSSATQSYVWHENSFQFLQNKKGWGQSHFFQFKDNKYNLLKYERTDRLFKFENNVKDVLCRTPGEGAWYGQLTIPPMEWKIDAASQEAYSCIGAPPMLMVAVMDSITLNAWGTKWLDRNTGILHNPKNDFGNINNMGGCKDRIQKYFMFNIDEAGINSLTDMLKNKIPNGNYVLVYCFRQNGCQIWDSYNTELHDVLENMGARGLRELPDYNPFAFLVKKGYPSTAAQKLGTASNEVLVFNAKIYNNYPKGELSTGLIGPSKLWKSIHWRKTSLEKVSYDKVKINLTGVKMDGSSNLLAVFPSDSIDILNLNNYVDANIYPYIKLNAQVTDDSLQSPPQINQWQVMYDEVPEIALNTSLSFSYPSDSVSEGEKVKVSMAVSNISESAIDSLYFKYTIEDVNRKRTLLGNVKLSGLEADSSLVSEFEFNTVGFGGKNKLWLDINPIDQNWQPEKYHFNNLAQLDLNISQDKINPLLDVTFDGVHILNGDIVSSKPIVLIRLTDENKYLALNDTADFAVYIKDPQGKLKRIYFSDNVSSGSMSFTSAILPKNSCKIEYSPTFPNDGVYELRVQAKDASQNASGAFDYVIKFEVINQSTITQVINYPNPFSNSTKFVFTLTGSEIPTDFKIQIMTISGKIVKEITQSELGSLRIGRNITDYAWDGKDEFGDLLANGVYLYRVITKINNKIIDHKSSNADQYFNAEFGKMYIVR